MEDAEIVALQNSLDEAQKTVIDLTAERDSLLEELAKDFCFTEMERVSPTHRAIRFCTSWATTEENVEKLCETLRKLSNG